MYNSGVFSLLDAKMSMTTYNNQWPELLKYLADIIQSELDQHSPHTQNDHLSHQLVSAIASKLGGGQFYLPKGDALKRALRDAEIYRLINKVPTDELARRHNLSMKQVWEIAAKQQARYVQNVQPTLL